MSFLTKRSNEKRVSALANKLKKGRILRFMEAHNAISGLIVDDIKINVVKNGKRRFLEFDGFWESSFTDSASKGLPDIEIVGIESRLHTINQIMEGTKKPMIVDGDTGGDPSRFEYMVKKFEAAGVSMVIIEDKVFPKRNSLETGTRQELEDPVLFAEKIRRGQLTKRKKDFMIMARLESLIAGLGLKDALERAKIYLEAGADGIMIHSKKDDPDDILEFAAEFKKFPKQLIENKMLCCVPTTYNTITERELAEAGFNIVIYANHMLRASYLAMQKACREILKSGRSFEIDPYCAPVKEIFNRVGFLDVKEKDKEMAEKFSSKIKVLIPAAGKDELAKKYQRSRALIEINGKSILERQIKALRNVGLNNFVIVKGYNGELFRMENVNYCENKEYETKHILSSLFCAQDHMNSPFIFLYSDILFNENIIRDLLRISQNKSIGDIVLVVDSSFHQHKNRIDRDLDLIVTKNKTQDSIRRVINSVDEKVSFIGEKIDKSSADYEFIGIAYFSENGAKILKDTYFDVVVKYSNNRFHEAENIHKANFTDIIQEIINRGYEVNVLKTHKGWMEIENEDDLKLAETIYKDA
ncbi:MAG: phosphoenolpyruvate mutase [Patescibacteria group bacterium]|nr:phosphoenolpyruvate mutase [Patescibacteria group bacterium]